MTTNVTTGRLLELEKAERKLQALEAGGVDNWDGYDDALEEFRKEDRLDELLDDLLDEIHESLVEARVDYPAGHEAGSNVTLTDVEFLRAQMARLITDAKEEF